MIKQVMVDERVEGTFEKQRPDETIDQIGVEVVAITKVVVVIVVVIVEVVVVRNKTTTTTDPIKIGSCR